MIRFVCSVFCAYVPYVLCYGNTIKLIPGVQSKGML